MPQLFDNIEITLLYYFQDFLHFFLRGFRDDQWLSPCPDRLFLDPLPSIITNSRGDNHMSYNLSITGVLADMLTGTGVTLGVAEGPKISFGGVISGDKILPLRVILLVPAMFPMSEVSSS